MLYLGIGLFGIGKFQCDLPFCRQELLQPDLLSVLGVMPSSEENLSKHLRDLEKSREKERETASNGYRQAEAKMSRLQAQREELE